MRVGSLIDIEHGIAAMGALLQSFGRLIAAEYRAHNVGARSEHRFKHADINEVAFARGIAPVQRHQNAG